MKGRDGWRVMVGIMLGMGLLALGLLAGCGSEAPEPQEPQTLEEKADAIVASNGHDRRPWYGHR